MDEDYEKSLDEVFSASLKRSFLGRCYAPSERAKQEDARIVKYGVERAKRDWHDRKKADGASIAQNAGREVIMTIAEIIEQLCELTKRWTAYEDIPKSQQHECRILGRELHKIGGESLMREAFYIAKGRNPASSVIQCYWDNIGDWQW